MSVINQLTLKSYNSSNVFDSYKNNKAFRKASILLNSKKRKFESINSQISFDENNLPKFNGITRRCSSNIEKNRISLFSAIENNDLEKVKNILCNNCFNLIVNASDANGITALHKVARYSHIDIRIARLLIKKGANINATDKSNLSPLYHAISSQNSKVAKLLIENGIININANNSTGNNLLHLSVNLRDIDMIRKLIACGANVNIKNSNDKTPFMLAIEAHRYDIAIILKEAGANDDINIKTNYGLSLLHFFIINNDPSEAKDLIALGADVNAKITMINNFGLTPLMLSLIYDRVEITSDLLENENIDVNQVDPNGVSTLMYAILKKNTNAVFKIANKVSNIEAGDTLGLTALDYARINNADHAIIQNLYKNNAEDIKRDPITEELIKNLTSLISKNDNIKLNKSKPNALVICPTKDDNKEFSIERKIHFFASLLIDYNVIVKYPSSLKDLNLSLKERNYQLLSILGHGTINQVSLTDTLKISNDNLTQIAFNCLDPNTPIFLVTCHAGEENGLAQQISKIFNKKVVAAINAVSFFSTKITTNGKTDINFYESPLSNINLTVKYFAGKKIE